jgi:hypothetical protein
VAAAVLRTGEINTLYRGSVIIPRLRKGKTIPLQAWTGHRSSRRLRFPDFKTIYT